MQRKRYIPHKGYISCMALCYYEKINIQLVNQNVLLNIKDVFK